MKFLFLYSLHFVIYFLSWSLVYSTTLTKNYTSYQRYPWCTPTEYMRYPKSTQDVVDIVQEAINGGLTVKPFGIRHSQTDIICTEGIPVDMRGIRFVQMHSDNVTATFGAGVTVREATEYLRKKGRALRTIPAYGNITLGGAIGTGAHGSTLKYNASISSQVVGLTIVDGLGEIQDISDPEDLQSFRIGLGLLGIIVDLTLYTVPLYKTRAHNYVVSDDVLTNGEASNWAYATDQIALYWFPAFQEVVVANWTIVDVNTPGNCWTNDHVSSTYDNFNYAGTFANEIIFNLTSTPCALASSLGYSLLHGVEYYLQSALLEDTFDWVPIYTDDGQTVKNPAVGYYDLMFAPVCQEISQPPLGLACPWAHGNVMGNISILDNEFGLALEDLPAFITAVKDIISKTPTAFPLQGILMRFSAKSDIYMSTAYGRDTVHFEFYLWNRKDPYNDPSASLAGYQTILQLLVGKNRDDMAAAAISSLWTNKFRARSHWGKSGSVYHNSKSLDLKLDPIARQNFVDAMNKFDPHETFINNFGRRIKQEGTKLDTDPLTTRCGLLDNCFCSKNSDCGATQICTSLSGYKYRVCKTRNEVPETSLSTNSIFPVSGVLAWFLTTIPTLAAAALAECSIFGTVGSIIG